MSDLSTTYLGLELRTPLVASAGPITGTVDGVRRMEDAGASAVVLPSLFEEQLTHEALDLHHLLESSSATGAEAFGFLPEVEDYNTGPEHYLELVERAKRAVDVPVIGSLNGTSPTGWLRYATLIQDAGADALELNIYFVAADPTLSSADVESRYLDLVEAVRGSLAIPLAVKIGPFLSSVANMALRLEEAGADGLVLFNRFLQPDIDPDTLAVERLVPLSSPAEGRLPRTWIALLHGRVRASLAATTGVATSADVAKYLLAGADVVQSASALLRHGPGHAAVLLDGLSDWMAQKGFEAVDDLRGLLAVAPGADGAAVERAGYVTALRDANRGIYDPS